MDHVIYAANKAKATEFLKVLHQDLETFNIDKVDNPKSHKEYRGGGKKKKTYENKRRSRKSSQSQLPIFVIPYDSTGRGFPKAGAGKGDPLMFLQDLNSAFGRYKWGEESDEYFTDQSDIDYEEISADEDSDGYREDFTSEDDNDQ
jgi:hypothetical protein